MLIYQEIMSQQTKLVGYRIEASLHEDQSGALVVGLRERLLANLNKINQRVNTGMILVQQYPDGEWTPDSSFSHIVGVEVEQFTEIPNEMVTYVIAGGKYIRFTHQDGEESIDETYTAINEWLEQQGYENNRMFDFEQWHNADNMQQANNDIEIYIPVHS